MTVPTSPSARAGAASLAVADVRAIVRLLGDTLAHSGDEIARKRFLLEGLARLAGADVWVWVVHKVDEATGEIAYLSLIDGGWDNDRQRGIATAAAWAPEVKPFHDRIVAPNYTVLRSDVWPDAIWRDSAFFRRYREPAGLDDVLGSGFFIAPHIISGIGLHRRLGRPAYTERERLIVRIVTTEVEWLHRAGISAADLPPVESMSPRLRHVMLLLLAGSARKQIAAELGISLHTVNEYVAQVYARLAVRSRAELMARFIGEGDR